MGPQPPASLRLSQCHSWGLLDLWLNDEQDFLSWVSEVLSWRTLHMQRAQGQGEGWESGFSAGMLGVFPWASLSLTLTSLCLFSYVMTSQTFMSTQGFWLMTEAALFSNPDSQGRMFCSSLRQMFTVGQSTMISPVSVKGPSLGCLSSAKVPGHPVLNTCNEGVHVERQLSERIGLTTQCFHTSPVNENFI